MNIVNEISVSFPSKSCNESLARSIVAAFVMNLDPTVNELSDIKTAVSEAVTNCIVHAYRDYIGLIYITVSVFEDARVRIKVRDNGCGIPDIDKAMEPLYTTAGGERAGLGFAVMQSFTDRLKVRSTVGKGTTVTMEKIIKRRF